MGIRICMARNRHRAEWDAYVQGHGRGNVYQAYGFKLAVEGAYGFTGPYFMARRGRKLVGILPTIALPIHPLKTGLVSLPYCDAGGVLADTLDVERALMAAAVEYARFEKIPHIDMRSTHPLDAFSSGNCNGVNKVRMRLQLPLGSDTLLSSFKSKLRSQIKKPMRDGLGACIGGRELLDEFYGVFCENMRDLGSPPHSRKWFFEVLKAYG
ncbi:MAG: hypothetical protein MI747_06305, partial [Desulfobacterales bacterium]|nr:hypothetical protein [Desulfobacterales bacterium]